MKKYEYSDSTTVSTLPLNFIKVQMLLLSDRLRQWFLADGQQHVCRVGHDHSLQNFLNYIKRVLSSITATKCGPTKKVIN